MSRMSCKGFSIKMTMGEMEVSMIFFFSRKKKKDY